ncbi:F-box protein PP2-B10-like [Humulus lupulus]|uniref:F-box protein PP2-B10-like n=1 Tax=Humulus lupulus TaxID=3486 RepID=UPI002B401319|nr:F-box protein PP2-B10-like [Humulus lupulus]
MGTVMGIEMEGETGKVGCDDGGSDGEAVDYFYMLPEGCIAHIVSLTSPQDACRLCLVSSIFKSAAESDAVWERFLPPGYNSFISRSSSSSVDSSDYRRLSKKDLYFSLCDSPVLFDEGRKSFSLDKMSGKKCYMLSARALSIVWGDTPRYWAWIPTPETRFGDVAELISVCWFEIRGKIDIRMLSPSTLYTANFVFKPTVGAYGFELQTLDAIVGLVGGQKSTRSVYLNDVAEQGSRRSQIVPRRMGLLFRNRRNMETEISTPRSDRNRNRDIYSNNEHNRPKERGDGWMEVELGEFFYDGGQEGELEINVLEVKGGNWKGGLIVQGIEIRPKKI